MTAGFGEPGEAGGLFELVGDRFERVDSLSTTALHTFDGRLVRALRTTDAGSFTELLVYDPEGVRQYLRVDDVRDPHDVLWDPARREYLVVSTLTNSVHRVAPDGTHLSVQRLPGAGDAWHVNSLTRVDGRIYASAFGRFSRHREWKARIDEARGVVFDLETGEDVVRGLQRPHHPRFVDESWVVCDSLPGDVVRADGASGVICDRVSLRGFTRGLAVTDDHVLVGESPRTRAGERDAAHSSVAVVSRADWRLVDRIPVFACELYDLAIVDTGLATGLRRGFRTNPDRVREQDQLALFERAGVDPVRLWAVAEPLPEDDCRVRLECELPAEIGLEDTLLPTCRLTNRGRCFLVSAPPNPVHVSYRWRRVSDREVVALGEPSRLPRVVPPGESVDVPVLLVPPGEAGRYRLELTVVQDGVRWFDEVARGNAVAVEVIVREGRA